MSGVAGGSQINKVDIERTYLRYLNQVLKHVDGFQKAKLTGSAKTGEKEDYGDLDIVTLFRSDDKKTVKDKLIGFAEQQSDRVIVPFKGKKYKGRKFYNSGEIITFLYPVEGKQDEFIQIDNIIALSTEELDFKENFLNIPAEKQGLLLGLAKVIMLEEVPKQVLSRMGIEDTSELGEDEELEFNLSSAKLELRKVKLRDFKEIAREEIWSTQDWSEVEKLLKGYGIDGEYKEILETIKKRLKNPRSKRRIAGIFQSMVTVKSGERGTEKGDRKQQAIDLVSSELAESVETQTVGIYAGGFKPPHAGHFYITERLSKRVDHIIIYIGHKMREGEVIDPTQSKKIWEIYAKYLNVPVEVRLSEVSPIGDLYAWIGLHSEVPTVIAAIPEDARKFKFLEQNRDKFPNATVVEFDPLKSGKKKISATHIRTDPEYLESLEWVPQKLSEPDKQMVSTIVKKHVSELKLVEAISDGVKKLFSTMNKEERLKEGTSGAAIAPTSATPSRERELLARMYEKLKSSMDDRFVVMFQVDRITVQIKDEAEISYDYTPYMASILEHMIDKGHKITPLPEIRLKNNLDEASNPLGKTAHYTPETGELDIYILGRHPKDVLRSFTHEMIHHTQKLEGRLGKVSTTNTNISESLQKLEEEAYLKGNMLFRTWEDKLKNEEHS